MLTDTEGRMMQTTAEIELSPADRQYGYKFGCEGLMSKAEAAAFLGDISVDYLEELVKDELLRKGQHLGNRRRVGICRRSVREYVERMEAAVG